MSLARWSHSLHLCAHSPREWGLASDDAASAASAPAVIAFGGVGRDLHRPLLDAAATSPPAGAESAQESPVADDASAAPEAAARDARAAGSGADGTWMKRKDFVLLQKAEKKKAAALVRAGFSTPQQQPPRQPQQPQPQGALNGRLGSIAVSRVPAPSAGLVWATAPTPAAAGASAASANPLEEATGAVAAAAVASGAAPCAREHHAALTVALPAAAYAACFPDAAISAADAECILLHGGRRGPAEPLADLWLFDPSLGRWCELTATPSASASASAPGAAPAAAPAARFRHAAAAIGATVYVYGGRGALPPSPTDAAAAAAAGAELCVFADLWRLDLSSAPAARWELLSQSAPSTDAAADAETAADAAADFDADSNTHTCMTTAGGCAVSRTLGAGPGPRFGHTLTHVSASAVRPGTGAAGADSAQQQQQHMLWLHGGLSSLRLHRPPAAGDRVWVFDTSARTWATHAPQYTAAAGAEASVAAAAEAAAAPRVYSHAVVPLFTSGAPGATESPARWQLIVGGASPHVRAFCSLWAVDTHSWTFHGVRAVAASAESGLPAPVSATASAWASASASESVPVPVHVTGGPVERLWFQPALGRALLTRHAAVSFPAYPASAETAAGATTVLVAGGGSLCFSFGSYDSPSFVLTVTPPAAAAAASGAGAGADSWTATVAWESTDDCSRRLVVADRTHKQQQQKQQKQQKAKAAAADATAPAPESLAPAATVAASCGVCGAGFPSKSALHRHILQWGHKIAPAAAAADTAATAPAR